MSLMESFGLFGGVGSNPTAAKADVWKTLVAKQKTWTRFAKKSHGYLYLYLWGLKRAEKGPRSRQTWGSVAEWSKALDLGSSLFGGVGSNPTAASSDFNQGREAL
ncbi:hypothetical protein QQF64_004406 [Cirrhinus molitorella]|uniref:Uncharacterized protein n=1 Tax=Cirrhinus molitorella TaxID=172907 RepID=A0ABR3MG40_9TELE